MPLLVDLSLKSPSGGPSEPSAEFPSQTPPRGHTTTQMELESCCAVHTATVWQVGLHTPMISPVSSGSSPNKVMTGEEVSRAIPAAGLEVVKVIWVRWWWVRHTVRMPIPNVQAEGVSFTACGLHLKSG